MYNNQSLLKSYWKIKDFNERLSLSSSQINNISPILSKLISLRGIESELVQNYLNPDFKNDIPNPFLLKGMEKAVSRIILAIMNNENIGIIADYDVDGSTSAAILFKFLNQFTKKIILRIPNRLTEGYGPNFRIMDEMLLHNINLLFTLDCGTSSLGIIDNDKYKGMDIIVIDHHLSESILPKVHSIINPNRHDDLSNFNQMAAVGVTFLFLMALRKRLREKKYFNKTKPEPNLLLFLDLVALGTVCDVVKLIDHNRVFVKMGLTLVQLRKNKGISKIIDNSNISRTPTSSDLGYIIGPQLNAASRIDDSSLASTLLISENIIDIENISKKLILLNEKRKLIEKMVFDEASEQAQKQKNQKYILVYGNDWHKGVLGIVASKLINKFHKPSIVISFVNKIGTGSARSIQDIDLGKLILNAKHEEILIGGGGHKMAAGLQIKYNNLKQFNLYMQDSLKDISLDIYKKIDFYDLEITTNEINIELLEIIEKMEPFGEGNPQPLFIIKDLSIDYVKIIKDKHLIIYSQNEFSKKFKAICFNCIGTNLGDYLLNYRQNKLAIGCTIHRDNFDNIETPQLIIKDAMIVD